MISLLKVKFCEEVNYTVLWLCFLKINNKINQGVPQLLKQLNPLKKMYIYYSYSYTWGENTYIPFKKTLVYL